jgi:hypothetical protein
MAVTVENDGKKSYFTSSIVQIRSDDVDIQLFAAWVNEQNHVISKVEIGNDRRSDGRKSKMV